MSTKVTAAYFKDRLWHWNKNPPDYYRKKKLDFFTKLLADQPNTSKVNMTPRDANFWSRRLTEGQWEHTSIKISCIHVHLKPSKGEEVWERGTNKGWNCGCLSTLKCRSGYQVMLWEWGPTCSHWMCNYILYIWLPRTRSPRGTMYNKRSFESWNIWFYGSQHNLKPTVLRVEEWLKSALRKWKQSVQTDPVRTLGILQASQHHF